MEGGAAGSGGRPPAQRAPRRARPCSGPRLIPSGSTPLPAHRTVHLARSLALHHPHPTPLTCWTSARTPIFWEAFHATRHTLPGRADPPHPPPQATRAGGGASRLGSHRHPSDSSGRVRSLCTRGCGSRRGWERLLRSGCEAPRKSGDGWLHVGSLKSAMAGVFMSSSWANTAHQGRPQGTLRQE